jgi:small subunit ribosomal protein S6
VKKQYEAMFLVSPSAGEGDKALDPVKKVLERAEAEVLICKKWDERKLAFEVAGQKRGVYVLTYFRCDGARVADIERDVQLSDQLLRLLVLDAEDVSVEVMNKPTPSETGQSPQADLPSTLIDRPMRGPRRDDRRGPDQIEEPGEDISVV